MKSYTRFVPFAAITLSIVVTACSNNNDPTPREVSINFAAQINGANFTCGQTYTGIGTGGDDFQVNDFRMYIHDIHIYDDATGNQYNIDLTQDGRWQLDDIVMLDFENSSDDAACNGTPETNTIVNGKIIVPSDIDLTNTEVCFTVGVPADKNHIDEATAVSPLNASGMLWAWKIGRKYIRIDGVGDPVVTNNKFNLHLGAQGCPGSSATAPPDSTCTVPNTFEACIANFDIDNSVIAVDLAPVLAGNDVTVNLNGGSTAKPGCQSFIDDNDCEEIMPRLGLDYSYGRISGTPSAYNGGQILFNKQ